MNVPEKFDLPSSVLIRDDIDKIDLKGMVMFEKKDSLWESLILGVPVKYVMAGVLAWVSVKNILKK